MGDLAPPTPATCVCGSDLWSYRGINPVTEPAPIGHEWQINPGKVFDLTLPLEQVAEGYRAMDERLATTQPPTEPRLMRSRT